MVQKPRSRRSKSTRNPVTIDLEANEVETPRPDQQATPAAEPVAFDETATAETASPASGKTADTASAMDTKARDAVEGGARPAAGATTGKAKAKAASPSPSALRFLTDKRLPWLGGGVIGGLVALLLAGGLQWAGALPTARSPQPVDLTPLQTRIDELASQVETLRAANPSAGEDVAARLEATDSAVAAIDLVVGTLQTGLGTLKQQLDALNSAVSSGGAGADAGLEALSARAGVLETALADLSTRIEAVETGGNGDAASRDEVDAIAQAANAAGNGVAELRSDLDAALGTIAGLQAQLASLEERLVSAESDIESGAGSRVAAAIAASALKSAADRGAGFMSELEAYAAVSNDGETVAALRDYAAAGVPTPAQLAERFPAVANRIIAAASGLGENAGILDRLSASARSIVQVRPVGEVAGADPGSITARMEVALKEGDLARAAAEWEALPEPSKAASQDFTADLRARRDLDTLIARVLSGAVNQSE